MAKASVLGLVRRDWPAIMGVIRGAGFTVPEIAGRIRSTEPTVRAFARGSAEPKHSQGVYLLAMQKAIKAGTLKPKDKK